jgi:membrane-associated protease RseP (regulator of RpoE activity)
MKMDRLSWPLAAACLLLCVCLGPGNGVRADDPVPKQAIVELPAELVLDLDAEVTLDKALSLGVEVVPVVEVLRAQLAIPEGQGVMVLSVQDDSPAAKVGLRKYDVVLTVGDQPVADPASFQARVGELGVKRFPLTLIREGKPSTLEITPEELKLTVQFVAPPDLQAADEAAEESSYWIGFELSPTDDVLRSHLGIPADQGLVVVQVFDDSPASEAGLAENDILLTLGDKTPATAEEVSPFVQEIGEKAVDLKLIRAGREIVVKVTPRKRPALARMAVSQVFLDRYDRNFSADNLVYWTVKRRADSIALNAEEWVVQSQLYQRPERQPASAEAIAALSAKLEEMNRRHQEETSQLFKEILELAKQAASPQEEQKE